MRQLSANSLTLLLIFLVKSLMHSRNRVEALWNSRGYCTWGRTHTINYYILLSVVYKWLDPGKNFAIYSSFLASLVRGTLSNAFEKSKIPKSTSVLELSALAKLSTVIRIWDSHECLFLKPNWVVQMMSSDSRWCIIWLFNMCSNVLQTIEVRDTGR